MRPQKLATTLSLCLFAQTLTPLAFAQSLSTAFTYQGELNQSDAPANGSFDLQFRAFDNATAGTQIGPTLCVDDVLVTTGRFTSVLDFGEIFGGQRLYLQVQVRDAALGTCATSSGYVTLSPRQELAATPYATYAVSAAQASTLGGQPRNFFQNASNLTTGTLPDARLSSNIARTNAANVFSGSLQAPTFVGSLTGNATSATNAANASQFNGQPSSFYTNASNISIGTLAEARLPSSVAKTTDPIAAFSGEVWSNPGFAAFSGTNPSAQVTLEWFSDQARISVVGSGAGTSNGFLIRTPTDASAFKVTDDGSVGIGTQSPEAPLHVRGGGSMGGIVVTPDVTDTQSQIVLSENTTASNAMLMRYNGTTNNIEIRGRAADVESTPHLTIGRDSGVATFAEPATFASGASVQGNLSLSGDVVLPPKSRTLVIPATAFVPSTSASSYSMSPSGFACATVGGTLTMFAPVQLPMGAIITSIGATVTDNSPDDVTISLVMTRSSLVFQTNLATITSTGASASRRAFSQTLTTPHSTFTDANYSISVTLDGQPAGSSLVCVSVKVNYEVTSMLP